MNKVLLQEELLWMQMESKLSKIWAFHMATIICKKKNRIKALKDENKHRITDQEKMIGLAEIYYLDLFKSDNDCGGKFTKGLFTQLDAVNLFFLSSEFKDKEVVAVVKKMSIFKTPCPHGLQVVFYQRT